MLALDMLPRRFSAALFLAVALFVPVAATQPLTARADCVTSNGATLCSDGQARGPSNDRGPSVRGPYVPYPCYDLYCGGGLAIALRD